MLVASWIFGILGIAFMVAGIVFEFNERFYRSSVCWKIATYCWMLGYTVSAFLLRT